MLVFDPTFFDGEERSGFYVTSMMKRCWAAQLEVLKEIEKICKRHNLTYFADFGTMLGAVRHKGFIPWDDDVDISMSRKDLNLFLQYAQKELPEGFKVHTAKDKFKEFLIRVVNCNGLTTSFEHMNRFHGFPFMAGIDIFVYDDLPEKKEEEEVFLLLISSVHSLAYNWEDQEKESLEEKIKMMEELGELCGYKFNHEEDYQVQLLQLTQYLASSYADDDAKEVALVYRLRRQPQCRIPKSYISDIIEVPFENITIPIPRHYDKILTKIYGNYMECKRGTADHDYPYFREQQEFFMKIMEGKNIKLPEYFYEEHTIE